VIEGLVLSVKFGIREEAKMLVIPDYIRILEVEQALL
jgi:hypothetical protein